MLIKFYISIIPSYGLESVWKKRQSTIHVVETRKFLFPAFFKRTEDFTSCWMLMHVAKYKHKIINHTLKILAVRKGFH